jgi:hypothetical protein
MVVLRRGFLAGVPGAIALPLATRVALAGDRGASDAFAGLEPDAMLGSWKILHVGPLSRGGRVILMSGAGERFELEVLLRDAEGPRPPGESAKFAVFVRNAGNGATSTDEDHGLAAMSLAAHLRTREAAIDPSGFLTMRERSATYARELE